MWLGETEKGCPCRKEDPRFTQRLLTMEAKTLLTDLKSLILLTASW